MPMKIDNLLQQVYSFSGTPSPELVLALFLICLVGEFGLTVPYLLETIWLIAGYHIGTGTLSGLEVTLLLLTVQVGRQSGATALYYVARLGSTPLNRLYQKFGQNNLTEKVAAYQNGPWRLLKKFDLLSPFSVAMGRLLWLRLPLTLALALKKKMATLTAGVLLSGLAWDGVYILVGAVAGKTVALKPAQVLFYSLAGLTAMYLLVFSVKLLFGRRAARYQKHQEA